MLTGVVSFLLVALALLAIPITLSFKVSWQQALQGEIRLLWMFGLVRIPISLSQSSKADINHNSPVPSSKSKSPAKTKTNAFTVIRQKPFRRRVWRFLRDLWKAIGKKDVELYLRLGFDDPADTGQLWAFLGPVAGILSSTRSVSVYLEPDFFEETFELDSSGEIRIVPLQLIYLTAGLVLSPSVRHAFKLARKR